MDAAHIVGSSTQGEEEMLELNSKLPSLRQCEGAELGSYISVDSTARTRRGSSNPVRSDGLLPECPLRASGEFPVCVSIPTAWSDLPNPLMRWSPHAGGFPSSGAVWLTHGWGLEPPYRKEGALMMSYDAMAKARPGYWASVGDTYCIGMMMAKTTAPRPPSNPGAPAAIVIPGTQP